ncbi:uncharacterized protein LOC130431856 isoform X3 [Triplophysa dalaica]|uniref:uncharacterized protein LOC130431856 isoform X3 n=1 Tax=Triplophysa dalaica TaxID=1582913 RepID=UPI0024E014A0|nr:uncharacterized protein LOC130431856 isoform X3 [Triplophysa dalaica]
MTSNLVGSAEAVAFDQIDLLLNAELITAAVQSDNANSNLQVNTDAPQTSAAHSDLQGFANTTTSSISPSPVNRLSRKRRRVAINSIPADQNVPQQAIQAVDFYTEDVLRGDGTETWSSVLEEISEAIKNIPEVILTDNSEVVTSSGVQGSSTTEDLIVPVKSSVDLPSNQYHFNHELMLEISEKCRQMQESLNIHSELTRRMYGCIDTLLSNSAEQGSLNRVLLERTDNLEGTLQRSVQSHENERHNRQLMVRLLANLNRAILHNGRL